MRKFLAFSWMKNLKLALKRSALLSAEYHREDDAIENSGRNLNKNVVRDRRNWRDELDSTR